MRLSIAAGWRSLFLFTSILLSSSPSAWAKKDKPGVTQKSFDYIPYNLVYFDDSDTILFHDPSGREIQISKDAGASWDAVKDGREKAEDLIMHPFDNKRAYIIGGEFTHWKTDDRGETWTEWHAESYATLFRDVMSFHAGDPDRIIFNAMDCQGMFCEELAMYTTDGFKNQAKKLRIDVNGCHWAKSSAGFTTGDKDLDADRILCVAKGRFSPWRKDFRLMVSDDFFQTSGKDVQEFEPELESGRTVQGIVNLAVVTKYLVVAATAKGTDEMALYVTDDTKKWHRAIFPHDHKLVEEAYTLLEGTNYSIQVDVMTSRPSTPMGVFFSSNSNGTFFRRNIEHTNRNEYGLVDFEKMSGIQGLIFENVVDNWEDYESGGGRTKKHVISKISINDGKDWEDMKADGDTLHLHSVTDLSNSGRVFSSPAPGLVMGIGNTGKYLNDYSDCDLYVSDDAGLTWKRARKGPHKYEFGGQGTILVAVEDGPTDEAHYSLDHGKTWHDIDLPQKIKPIQLTTTADSTSLKFMLEALDTKKSTEHAYLIALDFEEMHERECKDNEKDLEKWYARVDDKGKPTCLMGHKQYYMRRKPDVDCVVKSEFKDPVVVSEPCDCTDEDFECDFNFIRNEDRTKCELAPGTSVVIPDGQCKAFGPDDTFKGSSGWRLIPGNDCKRASGAQRDDLVDIKCSEVSKPSSGKVDTISKGFEGDKFLGITYLERTGVSAGLDETVIVRTTKGVWISHDHGKTWTQPAELKDAHVVQVIAHPFFNDMVFFLTTKDVVYYSTERGKNIRSFKTPLPPAWESQRAIMNFHESNKDWFIWSGGKDCDNGGNDCHAITYATDNRGDEWTLLQRYVDKCEFIRDYETRKAQKPMTPEEKEARAKLIFCQRRKHERSDPSDNPWVLTSSENFYRKDPKVHFENVVINGFATMAEFTVIAVKDEEAKSLHAHVSVDGQTFAEAQWPHGFKLDHEMAYTVLDSSTHSVFLHVTTSNEEGLEYGTIVKSNSNGTFYYLQLDAADRDHPGYVDFEKMFGLEGVAMVNQVANAADKDYKKDGKKLKTVITHNDGAEWSYLPPPALDSDKKKFDCSGPVEKCALHIHGYTERRDKSHTYSSASAIGLMFGTGNVGEYLGELKDADTFMTADAGITWKHVKKGKYMWKFGDQGSIVVIVSDDGPTKTAYYSKDEGETWVDYPFYENDVTVLDLTTVPSDNSLNFLIWAVHKDESLVAINLDFSGLPERHRECKLDEGDLTGGDYTLWQPKHPKQDDDCLFGHVSQYHRKKPEADCYNGRIIPHLHDIAKNCSCTRQDYECDFNYVRQTDGTCGLVPGYTPPDHSLFCQQGAEEWSEPTGYRRITQDTCTTNGALGMDESKLMPCPGKEDDFKKKHGPSAVGIFFAVTIPFLVAGGIGYYVWKNWTSHFGQIRLGEQSSFDSEAPWIKYPILIVAGLVAAAQAAPLLLSSLWRSASNALGITRNRRFTTRDSFARGRGDYAVVDEDEGELLGEDSDEDV